MESENVTSYIENAESFARPILSKIRKIVHQACPEIEENLKWSFPHFIYRGKIICSMAAFKQHCAFTFWLATQLKDQDNILQRGTSQKSMGHLGRLQSPDQIPDENILISYIHEAMNLSQSQSKVKQKQIDIRAINIPGELEAALKKNKEAHRKFNQLPYSHRMEYVNHITEAKKADTRERRITKTIEKLLENA